MRLLCVTQAGSTGLGDVLVIENFFLNPSMASNQEICTIEGDVIGKDDPIFNVAHGGEALLDYYTVSDFRSFMIRFERYEGYPFQTNEEMADACMKMLVEEATSVHVSQAELNRLKENAIMAKKKSTPTPAADPATADTAAAAGTSTPAAEATKRAPPPREKQPPKLVKLKRMPDAAKKEDHLPKQAVGVLTCLEKNGGAQKGMMEDKLAETLISGNFIVTRQSGEKIWNFYKKDLYERGFVEIVETAA